VEVITSVLGIAIGRDITIGSSINSHVTVERVVPEANEVVDKEQEDLQDILGDLLGRYSYFF